MCASADYGVGSTAMKLRQRGETMRGNMTRTTSGLLASVRMTCFVCEATAVAQGLRPIAATEKAAYETIPAAPPHPSL